MLQIKAENIGKKFKNEWIYRNLNLEISINEPLAITGPNGSGKSTLMQSLAGIIPITEGNISYFNNQIKIEEEDWHQQIAFSSPYMELIEEFTLTEIINFHIKFRPLSHQLRVADFIDLLNLKSHKNKQIKNFSSGMKQKLKLGLAFFNDAKILYLDEPTANLDENGFNWYLEQIKTQTQDKCVIISSNEKKEFDFCEKRLNILDFK